ncbi:MAG: dihydrofolate reductase family protein [Parabacteroides sp.]|nr:dihydrofolate reductase family protein [Parabacteroides sp.]
MAKIQIIMALTLDGFLPHEEETLMRWVKENSRHGFPLWREKNTFSAYPHYGLMDLINVATKHDNNCIYLVEIQNKNSAKYAEGLFRYNLVDEIVLYLLPLSYGKGIPFTDFQSAQWKLHTCKTFSNDICRIVYKKE